MCENKKVFFKVIIPAYNCEKYIERCVKSIEEQTFKDFEIVVVDDMSSDNTIKILRDLKNKYQNLFVVASHKKRYNGGARNVGIDFKIDSSYTLFIDNDDYFHDENVFQDIYDKIIESDYPDCVSLSYGCKIGANIGEVSLIRDNIDSLVNSLYVACWTKCIKSDKVVKFPENTLMEDVVQHIAQCDVLDDDKLVSLDRVCVVWDRNNENSCSLKPSDKRKSSEFRQVADLMDLYLEKDICVAHRDWRVECMKDTLFSGGHLY